MTEVDRIFREEYGRAVSVLARSFGDLSIAEDAVQDAFTTAVERWPITGVPPSPAGWIITTARHRAIDRLRREASRDDRHAQAALLQAASAPESRVDEEESPVPDERLRLMFTCCHPALGRPAQIALTLRLIGGLTTREIAHAFLVPEATMAQRLVRAKGKIRDARIPYRVPETTELPGRLSSVLTVIHLIGTEAHTASSGDSLTRPSLAAEAIRLARLVVALLPEEPEAAGLLALLLLSESRRRARVDATGDLMLLADQDRSLWDHDLIAEGQSLVIECVRRGRPGPFQLQAALNAVHSDAPTVELTDWSQLLVIYDQLLALAPSPIVALNRAVVLAEVEGPAAALPLVEALSTRLDGYHVQHAVLAELLTRLGREAEASVAYDRAIALTANEAEKRHLRRRRALSKERAED